MAVNQSSSHEATGDKLAPAASSAQLSHVDTVLSMGTPGSAPGGAEGAGQSHPPDSWRRRLLKLAEGAELAVESRLSPTGLTLTLHLPAPTIIGDERVAQVYVLAAISATMGHRVLILGETGSGKELVARFAHAVTRRRGRFIAVNCGAVPPSLLADELYGHERAAFTGAESMRPGLFEESDGGTVLLDEIGDAPHEVQVSLLRTLEERSIQRVGGNRRIPFDAVVIAATKHDPRELIAAGTFREDLYHRLGNELILPPLRERRSEIILIAETFLRAAAGDHFVLGQNARRALEQHNFPGNIRQLRNAIDRAKVHATSMGTDHIDASMLGMESNPNSKPTSAAVPRPAVPHTRKNQKLTPEACSLIMEEHAKGTSVRKTSRILWEMLNLQVDPSNIHRYLKRSSTSR
ncbi:MAG: sigma 54-interacting transcriptional regulator [Polyangiales bacterium]